MRSFRFLALIAALLVVLALPAQAETSTSLEAAQMLQQTLGPGKSITGSDASDILAALTTAAARRPDMLTEMAALIAVARPDIMADLKKAIAQINPASADSIIRLIEQASINPTIDQLAALAGVETAPAADSSGGSGGSSPPGDADLGWVAGPGDGSPN